MSSGRSSINSQQNLTAPNSTGRCIYEFEDFRLDAAHLMLYKNETTVSLKPKVVETLVALIERRGEVIGKNELMNRLWPDSFVEEANLSQNIYLLRKTLGNCADGQPVIETFWRRGYRFNCKVRKSSDVELLFATHTKTFVVEEETIEEESERNAVSGINQPVSGQSIPRNLMPIRLRNLSKKLLIAVVLISGSFLIFSAVRFFPSGSKTNSSNNAKSAPSFSVIKMTRLTPDLNVDAPAISSEGEYLAYDLNEGGKHGLWVKDILSGSSTRILPPMDSPYYDVKFSPDGAYVYYNRSEKGHPNRTIFRVPTTGGEPQPIAYDTVSPLTFSPDQKRIAFVRFRPGEHSIILVNSEGSGREQVLSTRTKTASYEGWASNLSWSPDGTRIAICGGRIINNKYATELIEVNVENGSERIITAAPSWDYLDDVGWLSDQSGLIVRARETLVSPWQIWHVSYPNGETRRITNDLNDYDDVSLSADTRFLVVRKIVRNLNIWLTQFGDSGRVRQITFGGTAADGAYGMALIPDGKIIYTSPRDGNTDLWVMNTDGDDQQQLTKRVGELNGGPKVTPDGRFIVFVSSRAGTRQIWRMDADGGNPHQLTDSGIAQEPFLSPDGVWIYSTLVDNGRHFIAKVAVSGGELTRVKQAALDNIFAGPISSDGKLMCIGFYDTTSKQPWKDGLMSLESGELVDSFEALRFVGGWTADSKSLIVLRDVDHRSNLWLQPIDGSEPRQLTKFDGGMIRSFAISPDFKQIAISRGTPSSEAILISNF